MGKNHAKAPLFPWPLRLHVAGIGASDDTHTFLGRPGGGGIWRSKLSVGLPFVSFPCFPRFLWRNYEEGDQGALV